MSRRRPTPSPLQSVRRFRMNFLFGTLLVFFALLLGRLGKLQLVDGAQYRAEATAKHTSAYTFQPTRGRILDRNGVVLAAPKAARRIGIDPSQIADARTFSLVLSDFLGGEPSPWRIRTLIERARGDAEAHLKPIPQYRVLVPFTDDPALVARVDDLARMSVRSKRAAGVWGVVVHPEEGRQYPNESYGAHVLGQMPRGQDRPGTGVEEAFHERLSGTPCEVALYRDGRRRAYASAGGSGRDKIRGDDVRLTLDIAVQHFLEAALDELIAAWAPTQATGLVLDPHSGDLLALANRPTFDPNTEPANANLAIQGLYEPGSFFKPFTVAWALGHDVVTPHEVLEMPATFLFQHEQSPIHDAHFVGPGTVVRLISQSSNTGAAELAHRLGRERMRGLFESLYPDREGGARSGLPYEKRGGPREATWPWWRAHRAAYGQGFHITPLQMISSFAAFARDDGRVVQPRIALDDPRPPAPGPQVGRQEDLGYVREGLRACVTEGTAARAFAGAGFAAAAKTATAEHLRRVDGEVARFENCSLVAYAPFERPQVVVLILAQVPESAGGFGGTVAGPYVRRVLERVLAYWNVPSAGAPELAATPGGAR